MVFKVRCPQCGSVVELDDTYGAQALEDAENTITIDTDGTCCKCGCWFNAFGTFASIDGFRTEIIEKGSE